jgi:hypothetical protein
MFVGAVVVTVMGVGCGGEDGRETAEGGSSPATTLTTVAGTMGTTDGTTGGTVEPTTGGTTGGSNVDTTAVDPTTTAPDPSTSTGTTADETGPDPDTGTTEPGTTSGGFDTCQRVDFLFVIDNSVSMEGEQAELAAAFPAFIATIKQQVPAEDYHVMVVDTDDTGRCGPGMCSHSTCQAANKYACQDIFSACDTTRGAGVVHPAGEYTQNMPCDFEPGKRYLESDDPNLEVNFECAAKVGTAGNPSERPLDGMVEAVSPTLTAPGGCNEGFLRDDAILVVTFISDDNSLEDNNSAQETYDALVAAKNGDADRIVMLGLVPGMGCGGDQPHWNDVITMFGERGIRGGVCEMEYNTFFQNAVATIADTCVINPG